MITHLISSRPSSSPSAFSIFIFTSSIFIHSVFFLFSCFRFIFNSVSHSNFTLYLSLSTHFVAYFVAIYFYDFACASACLCVCLMIRYSTSTQVDECNAKYHINLHHYFVRSRDLVHTVVRQLTVRWVTLFMSFFLTLSHRTHTHTNTQRIHEMKLFYVFWYNSNDLIGSAALAAVASTCKERR